MCQPLGRPDLAVDPRFATLQGRIHHGGEVNDELAAEILRFTTAELVDAARPGASVPVAPVNTRESMLDDPQVQHRGIVVESDHPTAGRIRTVRPPAQFSPRPPASTATPPLRPAHRRGPRRARLVAERIDALRDAGTVR